MIWGDLILQVKNATLNYKIIKNFAAMKKTFIKPVVF